ncbi:hypothetical protein [Patulibacter americanus]|uniref:hypothetical protein n=1 Tax=Patulibacter americanus TaxID=588672 RepID=UPI0003B364ED|nr:hypothetical protein [Patulibacter americanus]
MSDVRPGDPAPEDPAGDCRSCGALVVVGQRYCLDCGGLIGARRLDPLETFRARAAAAQPAPVPVAASPPRAVPFAAAATAVLVAGVSGMLVAGGDGGARAAVIARAPAAAPAAPVVVKAPKKPTADADAGDDADAPAAEPEAETAAVEETPLEETPVEDVPVEDTPVDDAPAEEEPEEELPEDEPITPHVWMLALDGPQAQEAVKRIADQGVTLTGVKPLGPETGQNVTGLMTGVRPVPAGATPPEVTPSLPEILTTAGASWRAYVDVQPSKGAALPGACSVPPVGDAAAAALAGRLPFGRIAGLAEGDACGDGIKSLETLGNDVSAGDSIPELSYAALGGCAPPERTAVALPDQVSDAVTAITSSTEYQENGLIVVTAVGAADPCPATPPDPAVPAPVPPLAADGTLAPTPTVVLRSDTKPGSELDTPADLLALTRLAASTLSVDPPGAAGADDVPALELPAADG